MARRARATKVSVTRLKTQFKLLSLRVKELESAMGAAQREIRRMQRENESGIVGEPFELAEDFFTE